MNAPNWAYCTHNLPATPSTTAFGTTVVCGANNALGSAVSAITLTHDVEYLVIGFSSSSSSSGVNNSCLVDVLVDPAGGTSWSTMIDNLLAGFVLQSGSNGSAWQRPYFFPIWIPAGAAVGFQGRTAHSSTFSLRATVWAFGGNRNPASWWCGQRVTTYGATTASSTGTSHTAGNSGSYSSWATIAASTSNHNAFNLAVQGVGGTAVSSGAAYHFQFGVGSTQIGPTLIKNIATSESGWDAMGGCIYSAVPSGTNLQVRGTCSTTAEALDVAIYGIS